MPFCASGPKLCTLILPTSEVRMIMILISQWGHSSKERLRKYSKVTYSWQREGVHRKACECFINDAKCCMNSAKRKISFERLDQCKCQLCGGQLWLLAHLSSLWGTTPPYFGGTPKTLWGLALWLCTLPWAGPESLGIWGLEPREEVSLSLLV